MSAKEADVSTEGQDRKDAPEDLELREDEAGSVKGGRFPIDGGGDSSGFSLGGSSWKMRRKSKKKSKSSSTGGGRPV